MQMALNGDSMARILIFFLKNASMYALPRTHAQEALGQLYSSAISRDLFDYLRDLALLKTAGDTRRVALPVTDVGTGTVFFFFTHHYENSALAHIAGSKGVTLLAHFPSG